MPHQCVKCGTLYEDGSNEILKGCSCGGKLFFYIKKDHVDRVEKQVIQLSETQKEEIVNDVYDIIGNEIDRDHPIVLDLESVNILEPGKYELDLVQLFKKNPVIYKLGEGKYVIDIIETFKNIRKKKDE